MKLNASTVAGLELGGKPDVIFFDDDLTGFGYRLRLGAGGKVLRSWLVQYRRAGSTRRLLLGPANVVTADAARAAAKKALAKVALGEDPQADRVERRDKDRTVFRAVVDEHIAAKRSEVRAKTLAHLKLYLAGPYFRRLHSMPIDKVSRRDIASCLVTITHERGSITAGRARAAISSLFSWAMRMGLVEANPVIGTVQPAGSKGRERVLSDAELSAIWRGCGDDDFGRIVRLLVLLAARRQEVGGMSWSELDVERGTWTLPAVRAKNDRAHTLPLAAVAWDIIGKVPRRASRDYLFGESGKRGFGGWADAKQYLDKRCGVSDWTLHDIRRSVATKIADLGVTPHIIEQILNHVSGHKSGVAGVYNRSSYEREVRAALALWADHIRALVEGGERKVVSFPAAS